MGEERGRGKEALTHSRFYNHVYMWLQHVLHSVFAKALINAAFLGPLPNSTPYNVSHRSCISHRTFHETRSSGVY